MIPDIEKLVGPYLRDYFPANPDPEDDELEETRVVVQTPEDKAKPWVKMTMIDASNDPEVTPDYLITYMLQCDCYAGAQRGMPQANRLGYMTRGALEALNGNTTLSSTTGTAVVTRVRFSNMVRVPDPDGFEPARDRVVLDALITAHEVQPA